MLNRNKLWLGWFCMLLSAAAVWFTYGGGAGWPTLATSTLLGWLAFATETKNSAR